MDKFLINGPCRVRGKVSISGSKNASLPILAATLLFTKPVIITTKKFQKYNDTLHKPELATKPLDQESCM